MNHEEIKEASYDDEELTTLVKEMREDGELGSVYTSVEGEFCVYGSPAA